MDLNDKRIILPSDSLKFNYVDKLIDEYFSVDTLGNDSDSKNKDINLYDYLPTTYTFFVVLFTKYPFNPNDCFVDIGCGKGRALMMAALFGCKHICGIEINEDIYNELMNNYLAWKNNQFMDSVDVNLINQSFFDVEIKKEWNKFFMFKPFNIDIFKQVMLRIYEVKKCYDKAIYIYLYHPDREVIEWIEKEKLFHLIEKDIQVTEDSNGLVKRKIRSSIYSNYDNLKPEKTYWRY